MITKEEILKAIEPKSDQLNADDLIKPKTIKITAVKGGSADQPVVVHYEGENGRPYKPCKSMRRAMVSVWGDDAKDWVGQSLTLYKDPEVMFGGVKVGGIRISHITGIQHPVNLLLTYTRSKRKPFQMHPLQMDAAPQVDEKLEAAERKKRALIAKINQCASSQEVQALLKERTELVNRLHEVYPAMYDEVMDAAMQKEKDE